MSFAAKASPIMTPCALLPRMCWCPTVSVLLMYMSKCGSH